MSRYYEDLEEKMQDISKVLKTKPEAIMQRIEHLLAENKELQGEIESLKSRAANEAMGDIADQIKEVNGVKYAAVSVQGVDMNGLRELGDNLKAKMGEGVAVIASEADGKVNLVVTATDGAVGRGAHAGNIIKAIAPMIGGGGGGKPQMAQAGGKNPAGIGNALAAVKEVLEGLVK